jgi:serine/alanine adding enzyme
MNGRQFDFVVFSDDWGRHPSSCQHLFKRIAKEHRVLWVNTIGLRAPKADGFTLFRGVEKIREWSKPLRRVGENMWVLAPVMLPVSGDGILGRINTRLTVRAIRRALRQLKFEAPILWTTVPTARNFVGKLDESAVVYYVTDDYSLWPGGNALEIRRMDQDLTQTADFVFACSRPLFESHQNPKASTVLLPHAVDMDHFSALQPEPEELKPLPHPRACFFGLIYEKIDLDSLYDLALAEPALTLVMIGPVKTSVDRLAGLPNVHFFGPKSYEILPAYLQAMDLMVVPYVPDEEIKASGPLKIRECLALGKPTVVRALPDLSSFSEVIHLYDRREDFVPTVRKALSEPVNSSMRECVRSETWESRVKTILNVLNDNQSHPVEITHRPPEWSEFLSGNPQATIFHDPRWGEVMDRAYGNRPFYLTSRRDGKVTGTLQLVEQKSLLFGSHLCSLPYFDAAGILAGDSQAAADLIREAKKLVKSRHVKWAEFRQNTPIDETLPCRSDKVDLRLDLPSSADELWKGLDTKVRNQIRKGQSSGLTLHTGTLELLTNFYAVYVRNMRDLGSPPHHRRFFKLICELFPESVRIFVIRKDGRPVAGALTLTDRNIVYVPWAASDWREKSSCPNMLLYWSMLEESCRGGVRVFDFGRSTRESGTWRFKKQWGAAEQPLCWQYLLSPGEKLPELRPDSKKFQMMVTLWRRLPVRAAQFLGPSLISRLS